MPRSSVSPTMAFAPNMQCSGPCMGGDGVPQLAGGELHLLSTQPREEAQLLQLLRDRRCLRQLGKQPRLGPRRRPDLQELGTALVKALSRT